MTDRSDASYSDEPLRRERWSIGAVGAVVIMVIAAIALGSAFLFSGLYDIGADAPHSSLVYNTLDQFRERSISRHARDVVPPKDLNNPKRLATGAGLYSEMCTGCHLAPGLERSELSQGLYPAAPELAEENDHSPAQMFWIIKHGVKLSAMPAWGRTHSDELIWDMVAFVRALPKMSPAQYRAAVASAPADHDEIMKMDDKPATGAISPANGTQPRSD